MQAKIPASGRSALIAALNRASREAGGLGAIFAKAAADAMGLNQTDFECIDVIQLRGRVTAGELAEATGLTTGAVTGVIDRLEKAGLARRERDADDRRKVYVSILPTAFTLAEPYYGPFEKAMNVLIASYSDEEVALLVDYFTRSRDLLLREIERIRSLPSRAARSSQAPGPSRHAAAGAGAPSRSRRPPRR
jgi:DNA-binding MarR family transcriptional regulator